MNFENYQELRGKEIEREKTVREVGRREGSREEFRGKRFRSYHL